MKARLETETRIYFYCPNCGERFRSSVEHFVKQLDKAECKETIISQGRYPSFGPWSCHSCGANIKGTVKSSQDIELEICEGTDVKTVDLLVLPPQKSPVYFIVDSTDYNRGTANSKEPYEGKEYFYEEHTCPINWIPNVFMVICEGDNDPHGLFEYVESIDQKEKSEPGDYFDYIEAFPNTFKKD